MLPPVQPRFEVVVDCSERRVAADSDPEHDAWDPTADGEVESNCRRDPAS